MSLARTSWHSTPGKHGVREPSCRGLAEQPSISGQRPCASEALDVPNGHGPQREPPEPSGRHCCGGSSLQPPLRTLHEVAARQPPSERSGEPRCVGGHALQAKDPGRFVHAGESGSHGPGPCCGEHSSSSTHVMPCPAYPEGHDPHENCIPCEKRRVDECSQHSSEGRRCCRTGRLLQASARCITVAPRELVAG